MTCTLLLLGALSGCAGLGADIDARGGLPLAAQGALTYRFAPAAIERRDEARDATAPNALRDGLAQHGFVETKPDAQAARYLVSVAQETRTAEISVLSASECAERCPRGEPPSPWFGQRYVHTLTLRFFALPDGGEAYRVSAVKRDRNADMEQALPYLVAGALAQLPYDGAPRWRVQMREPGKPGAMPEIVSVKRLRNRP